MGRKKLEIKTGERYGRLTIEEEVEPYIYSSGRKDRRFRCRCDCGSPTIVLLKDLRNGSTQSCGCLQKEVVSKTNEYDLSGEIGVGYTFKREKFYFDKEDYELIKDYSWCINDNGYVITVDRTTGKRMRLHRLVMGVDGDLVVDHINHDKTNNCKSNLRVCTQSNNVKNRSNKKNSSSGFMGVSWNKKSNKWHARIKVDGKLKHLGYYTDINEAIRVRIHSEIEMFGEYAPTYNYFTREQRESILDDTMQSEEIVEILKLNQYIERCV